jgi:predicted ATPase
LQGQASNRELMSHSINFPQDEKYKFNLLDRGHADYLVAGRHTFTRSAIYCKDIDKNRAVYHMPLVSHTYQSMLYYQYHAPTVFKIHNRMAVMTFPSNEEQSGIEKLLTEGFIIMEKP